MKNIYTTLLSLLVLTTLSSCYDDDYDDYYREIPTDFNKDISNITDFYLSNPVNLEVTGGNFISDTLFFKVGDTMKLKLSFNAIYEEPNGDKYDLLKSTKANSFELYLSNYIYNGYSNYFDDDLLDLKFLEENPELKVLGLTKQEILNSSSFHNLYLGNKSYLEAKYNEKTQRYSFYIGFIAKRETGLSLAKQKNITGFIYGDHIRSTYNYYIEDEISISIPVNSLLFNRAIVIEE